MIALGIETSCDETAVAIVEDGFTLRTNLIARQEHLHERFGGVVPEVAARAHVEALNPLLARALDDASIDAGDVDVVAVTAGPGLVGALLVGMAAAKAFSLATGSDLIGVNHLEGHVWANFLEHGPPSPPFHPHGSLRCQLRPCARKLGQNAPNWNHRTCSSPVYSAVGLKPPMSLPQ